MCRFLAYKGEEVLISNLLTEPYHSLIKQSYCSKLRSEPLNGDGFGLGWYDFAIDSTPGLFTSLTPAWGDRNLERLAAKLRSHCFFAHVRAATAGFELTRLNCHPFQYGRMLWMHNGNVEEFVKIKRRLQSILSDDLFHMIQGTTDSENAFALFLHFLGEKIDDCSTEEMLTAMKKTLMQLKEWEEESGVVGGSRCNFAVTDGKKMVITRFATHGGVAESLYYSHGEHFACLGGVCQMQDANKSNQSVIVSSEPLTEELHDWHEIKPNSIIIIDEYNEVEVIALS